MKRAVMLLAALLTTLLAQAAPANQSAKAYVESLYAAYSQPHAPSPLGKDADKIFTPSLLAKIRADQTRHKGEVDKLDHDPLCDCQDADGLKLVGVTMKPVSRPSRCDGALHAEHQAPNRSSSAVFDASRMEGGRRLVPVDQAWLANLPCVAVSISNLPIAKRRAYGFAARLGVLVHCAIPHQDAGYLLSLERVKELCQKRRFGAS